MRLLAVLRLNAMADTGWLTATGTGSHAINGVTLTQVLAIQQHVKTVTSPRVRALTTGIGASYQYAGAMGLSTPATDDLGAAVDSVTFNWHVRFKDAGYVPPSGIQDTKIWWQLPSGIDVRVKVFY
jgi:hypothetical protein